eukprot:759490-Hanusia_phi.AAC.4
MKRVFYLPRSSNPEPSQSALQRVDSQADLFPCRSKFEKLSSRESCCLDSLGRKFWMTSEIKKSAGSADEEECTVSKINADKDRSKSTSGTGQIFGLQASKLKHVSPGVVLFQLDPHELQLNAALSRREHNGESSLETYIGMATFATRDALTYAGAVKRSLSLLPVKRGMSLRTSSVDFVSIVLNQIDLNGGATHLDYIQVLLVLSSSYVPNGDVIPLNSIYVGKGVDVSNVNFTSACMNEGNSSIWDDVNLRRAFSTLDSSCAPILNLCESKYYQTGENFISLGIPLGENFYTASDMAESQAIYLEFTATVQDQNGTTVSTEVQIMVPLIQNGYVSWCSETSAVSTLSDLANVDIIIGSTNQISDLQNGNLVVLDNVLFQATQSSTGQLVVTNFSAASPESALLTLGAADNLLELVDVISLHFPDPSVIFDEFMSLLFAGQAFVIDTAGLYPRMTPTSALLDLCNTVASTGCFLRYDMQDRVAVKQSPGVAGGCVDTTVMELNGTAQTMEQNSFFQSMFGMSEYSRNLGVDFATIIQEKYLLNGRYNRAWWLNPANCYNQTITWYPAKVAMISLISLYSSISSRRAAFDVQLNMGGNSFGLSLPVNPAEQAARALGFVSNGAIVYNFRTVLSVEQSSMEQDKLRGGFQSILATGLSGLASLREVKVLALRREATSRSSSPTAMAAFFKVLIIFQGPEATFEESALVQILPLVHIISCSVSSGVSRVHDPRLDLPANAPASSFANSSTSSKTSTQAPASVYSYILVCCGVVGFAYIAAFSISRYQAKRQQNGKDDQLDESLKATVVADLVLVVRINDVEDDHGDDSRPA